ncbi:MAG: FMN-binding protein [Thermoanaerobaculia bacterium]
MSWNWVSVRPRVSLPETPRLALTLAVAGLFSGLVIVGTYRGTLPAIEANQAEALRRAVLEVLPGAERMAGLAWSEEAGALVPAGDAAAPAVYAGYTEGGRFVGYAVPASGAGFQDTISLLYGYDPDRGRIVGMAVLESRETPGLGDRIYKDETFVGRFRDLAPEPRVELVKEEPGAPNEVDAITGATISSAAVVDIINAGNEAWLERLEASPAPPAPEEGSAEPAPAATGGPIPGGRE